jgi:hypothetical protein
MSSEETNRSAEGISGRPAALEVDGVPIARGLVSFYPNPDRGKFWPDRPVGLEAPLVEAILALLGSTMRIRAQDVRLSNETPVSGTLESPIAVDLGKLACRIPRMSLKSPRIFERLPVKSPLET